MCRTSQYHVINKEISAIQMNFEHLNHKLLRSITWINKPKIGNTYKNIRYRNYPKGRYMTMRQIMENDMAYKQHCETNRCTQWIYTIEHAHSSQ